MRTCLMAENLLREREREFTEVHSSSMASSLPFMRDAIVQRNAFLHEAFPSVPFPPGDARKRLGFGLAMDHCKRFLGLRAVRILDWNGEFLVFPSFWIYVISLRFGWKIRYWHEFSSWCLGFLSWIVLN